MSLDPSTADVVTIDDSPSPVVDLSPPSSDNKSSSVDPELPSQSQSPPPQGEDASGSEGSEGEDGFDEGAMEMPKPGGVSTAFVMGNKARTGGRDTQFYQVLNVSESWQRNHTLSKKEDQKLLDSGELLNERLKGRGYVIVEILNFFHDKEGERKGKYKVMIKEGDKVPALKAKISDLIEANDWTHLQLLCNGSPIPDDADVVKALKKFGKGTKWPTPYFGIVWVCPK
ncbi:hypothetical protein TrCOL_g376 [Triparma columacea]|uniref:Uncharacterized protein n=1 Tax=Triparma columacea TaxID=722753 RepID=A0A9W7GGW8_9STRA|nr:hypothetical protein TrCOL_g376 [Triparma columacea]